MINEAYKKELEKKVAELCEKHGIATNLTVEDYVDDSAHLEFPKELANDRGDAITAMCEDFEKIEGIANVYDKNRGCRLRGTERRRFEFRVKDGLWRHTDDDAKRLEQSIRAYYDKDYAAELKKKQLEERRKYWKEYLIDLPPRTDNPNTELYLTMAYEPYDEIKSGEKTNEMRAYTESYARKLLSHDIRTVKFQRGYGGPGRPKPEQMVFEVKSITLYDCENSMECDPFNPTPGIVPTFFCINLGKRIS